MLLSVISFRKLFVSNRYPGNSHLCCSMLLAYIKRIYFLLIKYAAHVLSWNSSLDIKALFFTLLLQDMERTSCFDINFPWCIKHTLINFLYYIGQYALFKQSNIVMETYGICIMFSRLWRFSYAYPLHIYKILYYKGQ